jgi:drug/metabolite transporter (DMT)-like permease
MQPHNTSSITPKKSTRSFINIAITLSLVVIMNLCFAATFSLGKLGLQYSGPLFLLGLRMIFGGCILLVYYALSTPRVQWRSIARKDWFLTIKIILFYNILSYVLEFWALQYMSPLKTTMLWSSLPFVSALLGYFLLHEKLNYLKWWGLLIGTAGMIPIMLVPDERTTALGGFFSISLPEMAMFVEVVAYAYGGYLAKRIFDKGYSITLINGWCLLLGGLAMIAVRLLMVPFSTTAISNDYAYTMLYALMLTVVSEVMGYGIYGLLLKERYTITFLNFSGFLCPIFGAGISNLVFQEAIDYKYAIAFFLILMGLFLFYREELVSEIEALENHS